MGLEVYRLDENTWRIEDGFVYMFLLKGDQRALLIDSGVSGDDVKGLAESLTALPVELLNTHGDRDHIASNNQFSTFYMHPDDVSGCKMKEKFPNSTIALLEDGECIDLGNRPLEIIAIAGHTHGSVAILDMNQRVLYSGDSVQSGHIYMFGQHRNPALFDSALKKLLTHHKRYDWIYPSHGTPVLPSGYVKKVASDWKRVCAGELKARKEVIFGRNIFSYEGEACGFYCDE